MTFRLDLCYNERHKMGLYPPAGAFPREYFPVTPNTTLPDPRRRRKQEEETTMANKRGRPKKLPSLQVKNFERQFREACIPAFLVDRELKVVYANECARDTFPGADQPDGLRLLLPEDSREECIRRIALRESFRLNIPRMNDIPAAIAVTPTAEEEGDQITGAMVLVTCPVGDRPEEKETGGTGISALAGSLRQPLSDIFATLAVMGRKAHITNQDYQYDRYLHSLNQASYQLLRNINNLVSYQRSCSGYRSPVEVVDFWERLSSLLDACSIALHGNEIPFSFEIPDERSEAHVSCCFKEIEDALMNLISNAYCHSRPGNRVEVTGRNISNGVVVTVTDFGRGIEPDQMDKIFSPFYSRGRDGEAFVGMGMGLSVAQQNIRANGGTIVVDSTPGKGTTITFTLPTCDKPLTPPTIMASGTAQYLQDHFSAIYVGLCDVANLPLQ